MPTKAEIRKAAFRKRMSGKIDVVNLTGLIIVHIMALFAFAPIFSSNFIFLWSGFRIAVAFWVITGLFGICLCYHRLLTHKSFQTMRWLRYILTILGTLAMQGGPIQWVGTHRFHHNDSDGDTDPHSPQHGFSWAHVFWVVIKDHEGRNASDKTPDLNKEPFMVFINKFAWLPQVVLMLLLFGFGMYLGDLQTAVCWVIWGIGVRTVFTYHVTWFVNSAAHTWGYKNFNTEDESRNLWWVAVFSWGEGWHNNHHGQQWSASHGMRWWEIDIAFQIIRMWESVGLAWDVLRPKLERMDAIKPRQIVVVR